MAREKQGRLVTRLDAIEEPLPLAQEIQPGDVVRLLHVVAERSKRLSHRVSVAHRLFELLPGWEVVVLVDADDQGNALRQSRGGQSRCAKHQSDENCRDQMAHCSLPRIHARRRATIT